MDNPLFESIEVSFQQFQQDVANQKSSISTSSSNNRHSIGNNNNIMTHTGKNKSGSKKQRILSKPINQLSTIIRGNRNHKSSSKRIDCKDNNIRRSSTSCSSTSSNTQSKNCGNTLSQNCQQENDKNQHNVHHVNTVQVEIYKKSHPHALRHVKSSNDVGMDGDRNVTKDEILLVSSSLSEEQALSSPSPLPRSNTNNSAGTLIKSRSENDLIANITASSLSKDTNNTTFQNLYDIMSSSFQGIGISDNKDYNNEDDRHPIHQDLMTCLPTATTHTSSDADEECFDDDNDTQKLGRGANDNDSSLSSFFFKEDFDPSTWLEVNNATTGISILGAAVMTATVVIHPLVFVAGAGAAIWAVGMVHGLEQGYRFFSDNSFSDLFWIDSDQENYKNALNDTKTSKNNDCKSPQQKDGKHCTGHQSETSFDLILSPQSCSSMILFQESPPNHQHLSYIDPIIINNFPPLQNQIVTDLKFPGLNALEFFEVFYADNAPYSFKEFQSTRGDIDIDYGKWKRKNYVDNNLNQYSFHPNIPQSVFITSSNTNNNNTIKFPTSSRKERVLKFKTLTKSYFGPAYATARTTQRVSKFSTRLVIIEKKTELFDVPFCDRFFVIERWVIEADKNSTLPSISSPSTSIHHPESASSLVSPSAASTYEAKLSVSVEVFMLKPCKFESQIRQKSLATVTEIIEEWSVKAIQALDLAIQKNLERNKGSDGMSMKSYRSDMFVSSFSNNRNNNRQQQQLLQSPKQEQVLKKHTEKVKQHKENMKVIEEKILTGDLEWCDIEIRHNSSGACGRGSSSVALAQDVYPDGETYEGNGSWSDRPTEINCSISSSSNKKSLKKGVRRLFNRK